MKKKKMITTMGVLAAACAGAYMYMNNKKKIEEQIKKYMTCPELEG